MTPANSARDRSAARRSIGRSQRNPVVLRGACEEVLGEIRTVIGRRVVRADHDQRTFVAVATEHVCGGRAGAASADDEDRGERGLRPRASPRALRAAFGEFFPHESRIADPLDPPAGDRMERGRTQRFTGPETETRAMPRTPHGVTHDQAVGERSVVVRTVRANREEVSTLPHQDQVVGPAARRPSRRRKLVKREPVRRSGFGASFGSVMKSSPLSHHATTACRNQSPCGL